MNCGCSTRLDGEILTQLARAFNLTSLERREFFAMASEVTDKEIVRTDLCNEEVFEQVWALLDSLQTPAFLMDPFCDIIGANRSLIAFHNINLTRLQAAKFTSVGINNLALLLSPGSPLRQILGHAWQSITLNNVQQ